MKTIKTLSLAAACTAILFGSGCTTTEKAQIRSAPIKHNTAGTKRTVTYHVIATIYANKGIQNLGRGLAANETATFTVLNGSTWQCDPGRPANGAAGNGVPAAGGWPLPQAAEWSLLVRKGNSDAQWVPWPNNVGPVSLSGSATDIYFIANDSNRGDNNGVMTVDIQISN